MSYTKLLSIFLLFFFTVQTTFAQVAPVIAVIDFENTTGQAGLAQLSKSIPAIMTTDLSNTGLVTLVERSKINSIVEEQRFSLSGMVDERTAKEAGRLLGADYLITGSYSKFGQDIRVDIRLTDAGSGKVTGLSHIGSDENVIHRLSESVVKYLAGRDVSLIVRSPHPLYTEELQAQILSLDKPWYKRWYTWVIIAGVVAGGIAVASGAGGGDGGGDGGGGGGGN